jgi:hypothetical protein
VSKDGLSAFFVLFVVSRQGFVEAVGTIVLEVVWVLAFVSEQIRVFGMVDRVCVRFLYGSLSFKSCVLRHLYWYVFALHSLTMS